MNLKEIAKIIQSKKKIGITYHTSPDGDAMGSALALLNGLILLGKDAYLISKDIISENMSFLPLSEQADGNLIEPLEGTELVIVCDCGNFERISANLLSFKGKIMNVDHHLSNDQYGDYNYVDTNAAATGEIIFELLKELKVKFNKDDKSSIKIGKCIYTTLVTDTGSFRHSNVTRRTHKIASELIGIGVKNTEIYTSLFDNRSIKKLNLMGYAFNSARMILDNKVAVIGIPYEVLKQYDCEKEDTSDIIGNLLSLKNVEVAVLLKGTEDGTKASLRSKKDFDVKKIAEIFGGGGHIKAAGLFLKGILLEEAKENIIREIEREMDL